MKAKKSTKFRVRPINVRNGHKAPYFIIEPDGRAKKEEIEKLAEEQFNRQSALSKYNNWQLEIEKI